MSNPIHSTSAKSVLPMLAMRGLATGLCAGCVVGLLRLSHDRAAARVALWLEEWREVWWTVPIWFGVLVALAVILRRIVREEPLISGSGIPQTELALAGRLSFTWWRVLLAKFLGSWLALFGGLALGREGPSIQMGGAVGAGFHALWRPAAPHALTGSPYVVAGAVAGLAASSYLLLCERLHLPGGFRKITTASLITLVCLPLCHLLGTEASHAIIGTLMILTPGIAFTMGIRDFVQGDYLSGTIRMIDALLVAACIAIGTGFVLWCYSLLTGVNIA